MAVIESAGCIDAVRNDIVAILRAFVASFLFLAVGSEIVFLPEKPFGEDVFLQVVEKGRSPLRSFPVD